jgi:ribosomal protein S1
MLNLKSMIEETIEKGIESPELENKFWDDLYESDRRDLRVKPKGVEYETMSRLIENIQVRMPKLGEIVTGRYGGVTKEGHLFSVEGCKDFIYVDNRPIENKYLKDTRIGDKTEVIISKILDKQEFLIQGSISQIYETKAHESLQSLDEDTIVVVNIRGINPAGYDVEILHDGITIPAFMPNTLAGINKLYDPNVIIGMNLEVMIESYSESEGTYIVSRRRFLKSLIPTAMENLEIGVVYTGYVTGTTPFGVFVEFNECLTGMIHKANISPEWSDRIDEIKPGMIIEFWVKEIVKDKIILTQIDRESLWDIIRIGQVIDGTVKDSKPFGILVSLDDETMGLIHISELDKVGKKYYPDDNIKVRVLAIDRNQRKIFLTPTT